MGLISRVLKSGGITPLNRFRNGSQRSRIADIGCRSHGMLGNQLSKTLTSKTPLYMWSHLAMPTTTTDNGVFSRTMVARSGFIFAKNNGPRVPKLGLAQTPFNGSSNPHNFEAIRFETERAIAKRVVIVLVDPASGVWVSLGIVGEEDGGEEEAKSLDFRRERARGRGFGSERSEGDVGLERVRKGWGFGGEGRQREWELRGERKLGPLKIRF
ncbi:YlmG protein like [Actinidia chinensis var. chinensis]|uniref:YlmG protein like n=1 Tax=Actinidia chinensis var. chinensis TaxID=1590841 RepID=A0A2R6QJM5_ACTCC|nr:YlmG protein like [Actinidia chinensis var. chinensis]